MLTLLTALSMSGGLHCHAAAGTTTNTTVKVTRRVVTLKKKVRSRTVRASKVKIRKKHYDLGEYHIRKELTIRVRTVTCYRNKKKTITKTVTTTIRTRQSKITVDRVRHLVPDIILKAFKQMNYRILIDPKASYAGFFDGRNQSITLRKMDNGYLLHELGHYVSFIAGFKDSTKEFKTIYHEEARSYVGYNKAYVTKDHVEYFAESFRDYCQDEAALRRRRPNTHLYIKACIASITQEQIDMIHNIYYL